MKAVEQHDLLGRIYGAPACGFGDAVIYMTVINNAYSEKGRRIVFSRYSIDLKYDRQSVYSQLIEVFNLANACLLTDESPQANVDDLNPEFVPGIIRTPISVLMCPTRWMPGPHHRISYQFDARFNRHLKMPSPTDVQALLTCTLGYEAVPLGKHMSIRDNIDTLAESDLFIGVDSGMSQLAYTVGTPMFLMRNGHFLAQNHAPRWGRQAVICDNAEQLIPFITQHLQKNGTHG